LRCEGPHQLTQKRPPTLVSVLQSLAAAEIANIRLSRDFVGLAIFDFFNNIGAKRTSTVRSQTLS
jgi:hypothetical protein